MNSNQLYPFMYRDVINLSSDFNLAKYIQAKIDTLKEGIYKVNGTDGITPITDWGRLVVFSSTSLIFFAVNHKKIVSFFKASSEWAYSIISGEITNGPF